MNRMIHTWPMWLACLSLMFVVSMKSHAKVYVWVKPDGTKVYSDTKPPKDVEVEVIDPAQVPTVPAFTPKQTQAPKAVLPSQQETQYEQCSVQFPGDEYVLIAAEMGDVAIALKAIPSIQSTHQWRVTVGDQQFTQAENVVQLKGLYRGSYDVRAVVIDESDNILCETGTTQFHVQRHIAR